MFTNMRRIRQTEYKHKRGFTLTEIAIVLGIIGLILGAIWVAASAVYTNMRTSKATTELLTIAQNVRAMYATSATVDPLADMPAAFAASTAGNKNATYLAAGVFPSDTLMTAAGASATTQTAALAAGPWGASAAKLGSISVTSATTTTTGDSFAIYFDNVPTSGCIGMLTGNTGTGRDPDMTGASAGVAGAFPAAGATVLPVLASIAQPECNNAANAVVFTFKLK
jgi:prepilin-type N-terminal cleavage/methylation domain-containing protein